ncbi:MAG: class I SAM-dependent methyltransferase [Marinosulfonomonas sp.]|nr:class I SAM-dependent methyltransferase [Marinosulfonomonas sp.]
MENGWAADYDFCAQLTQGAASILDLGCGTGEFATHLAKTKQVTAVDPATAMLEIARARMGADRVTWVKADATTLALNQKFDLILLTGHSFQVFLTPDSQLAALKAIAAHLSKTGRFVFDSRNPMCRAWEGWTSENTKRELTHPVFGKTKAWTTAQYVEETSVVTYHTHYKAAGRQLHAASQIRFTEQTELARQITKAGLSVDHWYGDWHGNDWNTDMPEIIPVGRRA